MNILKPTIAYQNSITALFIGSDLFHSAMSFILLGKSVHIYLYIYSCIQTFKNIVNLSEYVIVFLENFETYIYYCFYAEGKIITFADYSFQDPKYLKIKIYLLPVFKFKSIYSNGHWFQFLKYFKFMDSYQFSNVRSILLYGYQLSKRKFLIKELKSSATLG